MIVFHRNRKKWQTQVYSKANHIHSSLIILESSTIQLSFYVSFLLNLKKNWWNVNKWIHCRKHRNGKSCGLENNHASVLPCLPCQNKATFARIKRIKKKGPLFSKWKALKLTRSTLECCDDEDFSYIFSHTAAFIPDNSVRGTECFVF